MKPIKFILASVLAVLVFATAPVILITGPRVYRIRHAVDHGELLVACRDIVREKALLKTRSIPKSDKIEIDVGDQNLPSIVRTLHPTYLFVEDHVVEIEMGGGFGHYGLMVFTTDDTPTNGTRHWPDKMEKLHEGVWYYAR